MVHSDLANPSLSFSFSFYFAFGGATYDEEVMLVCILCPLGSQQEKSRVEISTMTRGGQWLYH
jgi:hypothetical protein